MTFKRFAKRNTAVIGLSVDPVAAGKWAGGIEDPGTWVNYPMIGDRSEDREAL
jgi:alkyl hydroperoxide reductase subunit AhpC